MFEHFDSSLCLGYMKGFEEKQFWTETILERINFGEKQSIQELAWVMDSFVIESTAESQGHDEVQQAMRVRSELANGTFKWTASSLETMKDGCDKLKAPTLRLDDCHPTQDKELLFEIIVVSSPMF